MADEKCILDPMRDCLGLQKANMLEKQMDQWRQQARETHQGIFDRLLALEKSDSARAEQYKAIMDKLTELGDDLSNTAKSISALKEKPAKRWESIVEKAITLAVGGFVTWILLGAPGLGG